MNSTTNIEAQKVAKASDQNAILKENKKLKQEINALKKQIKEE